MPVTQSASNCSRSHLPLAVVAQSYIETRPIECGSLSPGLILAASRHTRSVQVQSVAPAAAAAAASGELSLTASCVVGVLADSNDRASSSLRLGIADGRYSQSAPE